MLGELKTFWNDEQGAEFVEWAVVVIILLVAAVVVYRLVGDELASILDKIAAYLAAVRDGTELPQ
ncbi:MAG: Flp family type IVb pilin [Anaerolineae bacterium]|jgi:Flp pilus assembly pilin Flp